MERPQASSNQHSDSSIALSPPIVSIDECESPRESSAFSHSLASVRASARLSPQSNSLLPANMSDGAAVPASGVANPFNFQTQVISTSPVKSVRKPYEDADRTSEP